MRNRVPPLQYSKKTALKNGGKAAIFACRFFEFWRGGTRFLIIFSKDFGKLSLITARDNSQLSLKHSFSINWDPQMGALRVHLGRQGATSAMGRNLFAKLAMKLLVTT